MRSRLFFILSFAVLSASGQESKWSYGITLNPYHLSYLTVDDLELQDFKGSFGIGGGFIITLNVSKKINIYLNPSYTSRNFKEIIPVELFSNDPELNGADEDVKRTFVNNYLDIPLGVIVNLSKNVNIDLNLAYSTLISTDSKINYDNFLKRQSPATKSNVLLGLGPNFNLAQIDNNWDLTITASINIWLSKFHDFLPEENPILFQAKFALLKSRD